MRRGVFTLDAIIAVSLVILVFSLLQGHIFASFEPSTDFGAAAQLKAASIEYGSRINAFYATDPAAGDWCYAGLKTMRIFPGITGAVEVSKPSSQNYARASSPIAKLTSYPQYPAMPGVGYDAGSQRVVK